MKVENATPADIEGLIGLARSFILETNIPGTYNEAMTRATMAAAMADQNVCMMVSRGDEGEVTGGFIVHIEHAWMSEPWAYLNMFYVLPEHRRSLAGRMLAAAAVAWSQALGCSAMFVSSTANIDAAQTQAFFNLFRRIGFEPLGPCLIRRFA